MKEIKFRAWDKEEKVMYQAQNVFLNRKGEVIGIHYFGTGGIEPAVVRSVFKDGNRLELMQYTGLKAKNGKEIYEGDIYKWGNTPVEYREIPRYPDRLFHLIGERVWLPEDIEIIGNIYENPELLINN